MDRQTYVIRASGRHGSKVIAIVEGPSGLDMVELYEQFYEIFDHGATDELLDHYHLRETWPAVAGDPPAMPDDFDASLNAWRSKQLWADSSGNVDVCFLNWLLLEYSCVARLPTLPGSVQPEHSSQQPEWNGKMNTPKIVLVVEDDADVRSLIELMLEGAGYDVINAENGERALDMVDGLGPNLGLILLDMRMPVMDGWQFARAYADTPGPHAPIVVCTAATDAQAYADQVGAASFLGKPFKQADLRQKLAAFAN